MSITGVTWHVQADPSRVFRGEHSNRGSVVYVDMYPLYQCF